MSRLPHSDGWKWMAALALAASCFGAEKESPPPPPGALSVLSQLGLCDARGAKWVRASLLNSYDEAELPGAETAGASAGNAWLIREEPKGRATLILRQARVVHARVMKDGMSEMEESAEPVVQIMPADLKADLARFKSGLEALAKAPPPDHESFGGRPAASLGQALLFCAHLQQIGRPEVPELLAKLLAAGPPETTLDQAITLLADGRLADLNEQWIAGAKPEVYAAGLEALAAQFHRGWANHGAVLQLAARVRAGVDAANSTPAAELLRKLRPADEARLPMGANWLLPEGDGAENERPSARVFHGRVINIDPQAAKDLKPSPIEAFFRQKLPAAQALAGLMRSHEILRLMHGSDESRSMYFSNRPDLSPEQRDRAAYQSMPRPYEMGELADVLLESVNPDPVSHRFDDDETERDPAAQTAWLASLEGKSEEEIAWIYLRATSSSGDESFRHALGFLVAKGSPTTVTELREVFLDPAVWQMGALSQLSPLLKIYVPKLGADGDAFGAKLLETVKTESSRAAKEFQTDQSNPEFQKQIAAQQALELKQLEQILHPRTLEELLKDHAAASEEDAPAIFEAIRVAAGETLSAPVMTQLLVAASENESLAGRGRLVTLLLQHLFGATAQGKSTLPGLEAKARPAALKLLADERTPPDGNLGQEPTSLSTQTMQLVLLPVLKPDIQAEWMRLTRKARSIGIAWARTAATAVLEEKPIPLLPTPAKVSPDELAALARGWSGQTGLQVLAAVRALPAAQQLGLVDALSGGAKWPEPALQAQLTIDEVQLSPGESAPEVAAWKGRILNEKLRGEMIEQLRTRAWNGKSVMFTLAAAQPLSGLRLTVVAQEQHYTRAQFNELHPAGLQDRPPPEALLGAFGRSAANPEEQTRVLSPQWKDTVRTETWRKENEERTRSQKAPPTDPTMAAFEPTAFTAFLTRVEAGDPATIGAFQITYFISPILADPKEE